MDKCFQKIEPTFYDGQKVNEPRGNFLQGRNLITPVISAVRQNFMVNITNALSRSNIIVTRHFPYILYLNLALNSSSYHS